jgi:hypothetical protein
MPAAFVGQRNAVLRQIVRADVVSRLLELAVLVLLAQQPLLDQRTINRYRLPTPSRWSSRFIVLLSSLQL